MPLGRGDLVDGRYRIIERIGDGARAQVYLAEEPGADGRRVALKVFRTGDDGAATLPDQLDLLQSLSSVTGKTIVMVTHDPLAAARAKRTLHLDKGVLQQEPVA